MPDDTRTLLLDTTKGAMRITIPAGAKCTFSAVNPQSRGYGEHCLRVYEGAKDGPQLAVFTGVHSFRDLDAVKVEVRHKRIDEVHERKRHGGHSESNHSRDVEVEWVDGDSDVEDQPF